MGNGVAALDWGCWCGVEGDGDGRRRLRVRDAGAVWMGIGGGVSRRCGWGSASTRFGGVRLYEYKIWGRRRCVEACMGRATAG